MNTGTVYALCDQHFSGPQAVYYVGLAADPLRQRKYAHLHDARSGLDRYVAEWIRGLLALGLQPEVVFLQENATEEDETRWIKHWRDQGSPLCNIRDDRKHAPETIAKQREISTGRRRTDEQREKISAIGTGRRHSAVTRAKMSAVHHGVTHTAESIQKMRDNRQGKGGTLGPDEVMLVRELYRDGMSQDELATIFGVSQPNVQAIVTGRSWKHLPLLPRKTVQ